MHKIRFLSLKRKVECTIIFLIKKNCTKRCKKRSRKRATFHFN
ncbi:unnamed protein product, partial [Brassica rapa subsp. narinosa]